MPSVTCVSAKKALALRVGRSAISATVSARPRPKEDFRGFASADKERAERTSFMRRALMLREDKQIGNFRYQLA
jgi:hypothetical protein